MENYYDDFHGMLSSKQSSIYCSIGKNSKQLEKRIPQNPRYKNIKPAVDSGVSIRKYLEALHESQKNINYKRDECFKRVKLSTFVKLIIQVNNELETEELKKDTNEKYFDEQPEQENVSLTKVNSEKPVSSRRSMLSSVIMGIGEMDLQSALKNPTVPSLPKVSNYLPYLLLDVRDKDDFLQCHIISAKNYPYPNLSRAYNYETKDMLLYKNTPNKLIIVYDEDESLASRVTSTLVQRGYDNIYMLSGGLKLSVEKFPHGLVNGNLPSATPKSRRLPTLNAPDRGDIPLYAMKSRQPFQESFTTDDIASLQKFLDKYSTSATGYRFNALSRASSRISRIGSGACDTASCSRTVITSAPSSSRRKPPWK